MAAAATAAPGLVNLGMTPQYGFPPVGAERPDAVARAGGTITAS